MKQFNSSIGDDPAGEIYLLIERLLETEQRLEHLTAGEVDTVASRDGRMVLLRRAQEESRHSETESQAAILNALSAHVALVDTQGIIISVNEAWRGFGRLNAFTGPSHAVGLNYLEVCEHVRGKDASQAHQVADGIRSVLNGSEKSFSLEYPCHSPDERRWFLMRVTPLSDAVSHGAVVMHVNITERKLAEESLIESEARFRGTFEQAAVGIAHVSTEGLFLRVNDKLCEIVGYSREELLGMTFADLTVSEDRAGGLEARRSLLAGEYRSYTSEKRYRRKTGEVIWVNLVTTLEHPVTGETNYFISVFEEITGRKRTEASVRQLASIVESSADAIISETLDGTITSWNPAAGEMFGFVAAEIIGRTLRSTIPADRAHEEADMFARLVKKGTVSSLETVRLRKDGQRFDVSATISPIKDIHGNIVGAASIIRDITARKRAEMKVISSEHRLRSLVEATSAIVWDVPASGEFETEQPGWSAFTGQSFDEYSGWGWLNAIHPDDQAETARLWMAAHAHRKIYEVEHRLRARDQTYRDMMVRAVPITGDDGEIIEWIGIHSDITKRKRAEESLRESEERFSGAFEHAPIGVALLSPEGRWIQVNEVLCQLVGYSQSELLSRNFQDITHPDDLQTDLGYVRQLLAREIHSYQMEKRYIHARGHHVTILNNVSLVRDEQGQPQYFIAQIQDITERKKAELALVLSERNLGERTRLSELAAQISSHFILGAGLAETLERCTAALVKHLDAAYARIWSLNEPLAMLDLQSSSGLYSGVEGPFNRIPLGSRLVGMIAREAKPYCTNDLLRCPYLDETQWAESDGITTFAGYPLISQGHVLGVVAVFGRFPMTDFTLLGLGAVINHIAVGMESMRAQRLLEESEELYRELFENASDLIQTVAADGTLLYVNRAWRAALGYEGEAISALRFLEMIHPDRRAQTEKWFIQVLAGVQLPLVESEFVSKSKKRIFMEGSVNAKVSDGKVVSVRFIFRDLTAKKKLEAQFLRSQRLEGIGALASGVAHDLNNILAPILMAAPMLRWRLDPAQVEKTISTIEICSSRGAEIVKQLLTFGRGVEGERVLLQPEHLMREMMKIISGTLSKSIRAGFGRTISSWPVIGDPTQLQQVLLNLCVNARDAMPKGGRLTLSLEDLTLDENDVITFPEAKPGPYVLLRVADTGTGIPPAVLERMFEPFFTTKELGVGTGLGLSTVLGIIKSHGGFLKVDTEVGRGTEFAVYLPAVPGGSLLGPAKEASLVPRGHGELVLVVDDEPGITDICRQTLEKHGYRVVIANDGIGALSLYAAQSAEINLVITDLEMPYLDGVGLTRAIKRMKPDARILIASAIDSAADRSEKMSELREIGVTVFLSKPFTSHTLLTALHQQFQHS